MATTNEEILNQIRDNATTQYQDIMPKATGDNDSEILSVIQEYPLIRNEFINTIVNKIVKTEFFNKVYSNPLSFLHKGKLPFGQSIEELFVEMAEKKNYGENFGESAVDSLIGVKKSDVKVKYITKNFAYKWKVTINEIQLRSAFTSQYGLVELINKLIESAYTSSYYSEYEDMKGILTRDTESNGTLSKGLIGDINTLTPGDRTMVINVTDIKDLAEKVRATSDRLQFISDKYNLSKVKTHTLPEDLVIFTTPEHKAKLDVNILAFALNSDKADLQKRIILLDEIGTVKDSADKSGDVIAILSDKDLFQQYTSVEESRTFENGDSLNYNIFLHKQGLSAKCDFVNAVVFKQA